MISIFEEEISDRALRIFIDKMFNVKILSGGELLSFSDGVFQGNILSSLFSNIYFSKLDEFVEIFIIKYSKGEKFIRNNKYIKEIRIIDEEMEGKIVT